MILRVASMSRQKKIQLENGTILFLGAAAFILLAASLFPSSAMSQKVRSYLEMNRMVERAFAVMLLVLSLIHISEPTRPY